MKKNKIFIDPEKNQDFSKIIENLLSMIRYKESKLISLLLEI